MPNYKGHLTGALVAFAAVFMMLFPVRPSWQLVTEWFVLCMMGALFPDIDTKSKGQKLFYRMLFIILIVLTYQRRFRALAYASFAGVLPMLVSHRSLFHRTWFIILCSFAPVIYSCRYLPHYCLTIFWDSLFFCVGALSHLWLDLGLKRMMRW